MLACTRTFLGRPHGGGMRSAHQLSAACYTGAQHWLPVLREGSGAGLYTLAHNFEARG